MSEIDDIFASKTKAAPPLDSPPATIKQKKKHKKKKPKLAHIPAGPKETPVPVKKRPLPDTIADPSALPPLKKRHRTGTATSAPSNRLKAKKDSKEEEHFKDSRGSGSSG